MKNQTATTTPILPLLFFLITLAFTLNSNSSQAEPDPLASRLAIPAEADRAKSLKLVKEIYKSAYVDRTPAGATKFAETLMKDAAATQDDAAARYVMLSEARTVAADAGDFDAALRAALLLFEQYKTDPAEMELDLVRRAGRSPAGAKRAGDLAELCLTLAGINSYAKVATAQIFCDLAAQAARAANKPEIAAAAIAMSAQLRNLATEETKGEAALARLKITPDDKQASAAAGQYLCLVRGDWNTGLPLLIKGAGSAPLRQAAAKDLAAPVAPQDRAALAETYWHLRETFEPALQPALINRAVHWYELALPDLKGLAKLAAEKNIKEAKTLLASSPVGTETTFNGHRYRRFDAKVSWHAAKALCEQAGARLIIIPDANTQKVAAALADYHNTWIGATDEKEEGHWKWVDGTPVTYSHWHPPEPDNFGGAQNWAYIRRGDKGDGWSDSGESDHYGFLCEWPN